MLVQSRPDAFKAIILLRALVFTISTNMLCVRKGTVSLRRFLLHTDFGDGRAYVLYCSSYNTIDAVYWPLHVPFI